jgi:hypothetical protein
MKEALLDIDLHSLPRLQCKTEWTEIQILTDPFVVFRGNKRSRYLPVVLVEESRTELKRLLYISAMSLSQCLEPIRAKRGTLLGVNVRLRKTGEDKFSPYEVEELAD